MSAKKNPYVCEKCGSNMLKTGVACTNCMKLLCPVCDCAYSVDYYCYCCDCKEMVANKHAACSNPGEFCNCYHPHKE